jgi:aldehyde dehydrogenase (NAD+)
VQNVGVLLDDYGQLRAFALSSTFLIFKLKMSVRLATPLIELSQIPSIVKKSRASFNARGHNSIEWRKAQLEQLYKFIVSEQENLLEVVFKDLGRPKAETMMVELLCLQTEIATALKELGNWIKPKRASGPLAFALDHSEIRPVPLGLVLIIGTWNYPVQLIIGPLIAAISGGNSAVLKFNEICVHTSEFMIKTLPIYMDNDAFKFVGGAIPETTALLEQKFDLIFYTGNTMVGKIIHKAANKFLTPVVLELGGKSPVIVDSDIDINLTAKRIMWGKLVNCGQTCVAPDYILVDKKVSKRLVDELILQTQILIGSDMKKSERYGKIVSDRQFTRLSTVLSEQLKVPGTKLAFGGETDLKTRYFQPTILTGIQFNTQNPIMQDEIFGPILPVIEYDTLSGALELVQQYPSPLACMPFSRNKKFIEKVLGEINCGNAMANDCLVSVGFDDLPFGGVGSSGMGNYHGIFGFETFTRKRATVLRTQSFLPELSTAMRYQNESYDRNSIKHKLICFVLGASAPSNLSLWIRHLYRGQFVKIVFYVLLVAAGFGLGKL